MRHRVILGFLNLLSLFAAQDLPPQTDSHYTGFAAFEHQHIHERGMSLCLEIGIGITRFKGVIGRLSTGDCAALYYLTTMRAVYTKMTLLRDFYYVETGAFLGLSSNVITQALDDVDAPGIIYSHDLFDMVHGGTSQYEDTSIWNIVHEIYDSDIKTHLHQFYFNVQQHNNTHRIIPIAGYSADTLRIHPNASADLIFIDGDHTYAGVLADLMEAWRILRPGGALVGHDCLPLDLANNVVETVTEDGREVVNGVRRALDVFAEMHNLEWKILYGTWYMFYMMKPPDS